MRSNAAGGSVFPDHSTASDVTSPRSLERLLDILEEIEQDRQRTFESSLYALETAVGFRWTGDETVPIN